MSSGIVSSGVSLSDAVKRIIGSLTPAERSAIASGGTPPPRVQALLDGEIKAAQQQRQAQLAATNTADGGLQGDKSGLIPSAFAAMDRDMRGRNTRSTEYSNLRSDSISSANYGSSEYARTGLNYATFSDLRKQGFNGQQIMAAVNTTRALGIDTNKNAAPMARVQRDIPSAVPGLQTTRDNWSAVKSLEDEQKKAIEAGNTAAAEALARQIAEARKHAEEHDKRERDRVQRERPDRAHDHRQLQDETRRAALRQEASLGPQSTSQPNDYSAGLTRQEDRTITKVARVAEVAAAGEPEMQQIRSTRAAMFGPTPDATQQPPAPTPTPPPVKQAEAGPPAPPAAAPVKTADATPVRPQASTPRVG